MRKTADRDPLVSRAEVAKYLNVPISTMNYWAAKRTGPPFQMCGRVSRYRWSDIDRWLEGCDELSA